MSRDENYIPPENLFPEDNDDWLKDVSDETIQNSRRDEDEIARLAALSPLDRDRELKPTAKSMGVTVSALRSEVKKASAGVEELLQRSIDELHRMRDLVIAGKAVPAAAELEKRIRDANAGFEVASDAEVELEAAETGVRPAEFTIEPDDTVSMVIVDSPLADELAEIAAAAEEPAAPTAVEL